MQVPIVSAEEQMIRTWSYSRLTTFEQCKMRAKLAYVDKIPEPERPLPPGKLEHANDRGTRIHTAAEKFVQGGINLIHELKPFQEELEHLRALYAEGRVSLEGEWGYNKEWLPVAWNSSDVWARAKLDALVFATPRHAIVIDYKTGKKSGNEIKHAEQGQLYQLMTFLRYPEVQEIDVEFWYTDQDDITRVRYTRDQGMRFLKRFQDRGLAMTDCDDFKPNPNMFSCKWCPYGPKGTGHCLAGV